MSELDSFFKKKAPFGGFHFSEKLTDIIDFFNRVFREY
ncbi:hypothetical protein pah_c050o005 [Parachlamydia acanthamoebae str. Hall's coccus]|nr:hypothetical protein pah_c050o005 [Parachlamydia acanthamoebae str. Hall's coccus]